MHRLLVSLLLYVVITDGASVISPSRMSIELGGNITIKRAASEPPFDMNSKYDCVLGRLGQFSLHIPPKNFKETGVHLLAKAQVVDRDTLLCEVAKGDVVTAGNTTVCVAKSSPTRLFPGFQPLDVTDVIESELNKEKKAVCPDSYSPGFEEHFPLFAPAFDRRPYFRETSGALLLDLDAAMLCNESITVKVSYPVASGEQRTLLEEKVDVVCDAARLRPSCGAHGHCHDVLPLRLPFSLEAVPVDLDTDASWSLQTAHGSGNALAPQPEQGVPDLPYPRGTHLRRLQRSPPPEPKPSFATFQVAALTLRRSLTRVLDPNPNQHP